jgi:hypothetical protein
LSYIVEERLIAPTITLVRHKEDTGEPHEYNGIEGVKQSDLEIEEIRQNPRPCCVLAFTPVVRAPLESEIVRAGSNIFLKNFKRTIHFTLMMGRTADAARIKVIQYRRNERHVINKIPPNQLTLPKQPVTPGIDWEWEADPNGWKVDSDDTDRTWPEHKDEAGKRHGLQRRGMYVTWYDRVGWDRAGIAENIDSGNPAFAPPRFPHKYSCSYRTDVFCSHNAEVNVASDLIARVTWNFSLSIGYIEGHGPITTVPHAVIDGVRTEVLNQCPNSPFF